MFDHLSVSQPTSFPSGAQRAAAPVQLRLQLRQAAGGRAEPRLPPAVRPLLHLRHPDQRVRAPRQLQHGGRTRAARADT